VDYRRSCGRYRLKRLAHSLVLVAFGIDSVIELASAAVLVWRLNVELLHGQSLAEDAEKFESRIGGALLFLLAAYVVAAAGWKLWTRQGAEFSPLGLSVSILAIPIMYILSRRKLELAQQLGSRALRADAIESITCGWLAFVVVAALAAQLFVGALWLDAVASLAFVWFLVREGREPWQGEECCAAPSVSSAKEHELGQCGDNEDQEGERKQVG
jgi:hypothetical protein